MSANERNTNAVSNNRPWEQIQYQTPNRVPPIMIPKLKIPDHIFQKSREPHELEKHLLEQKIDSDRMSLDNS